jgi:general stress protein YciG
MPKLEKWIVASRKVAALDKETRAEIDRLGGQVGGGWTEVHRHILVNPENKEAIEDLLRENGYEVSAASDKSLRHPDSERAPRG